MCVHTHTHTSYTCMYTLVFKDRFSLGSPGTHSIAQAGLEVRDPLALPLKCWD